jgi:hypothetical protein
MTIPFDSFPAVPSWWVRCAGPWGHCNRKTFVVRGPGGQIHPKGSWKFADDVMQPRWVKPQTFPTAVFSAVCNTCRKCQQVAPQRIKPAAACAHFQALSIYFLGIGGRYPPPLLLPKSLASQNMTHPNLFSPSLWRLT